MHLIKTRNINMDHRSSSVRINSKKTNCWKRVPLRHDQASSSRNNSRTNGCIAEGNNAAENTQLHNITDTGSALTRISFAHSDGIRDDWIPFLGTYQSNAVPRQDMAQVQRIGVQAFDTQQFGSLPNIDQMPLNYGNAAQFPVEYHSYGQHLAAPTGFYGTDEPYVVPVHSQPQHALGFKKTGLLQDIAFEGGNYMCQMPFGPNNADQWLGEYPSYGQHLAAPTGLYGMDQSYAVPPVHSQPQYALGVSQDIAFEEENYMSQMPFGHNNAAQSLGGGMHINYVGEGYQYNSQNMQPAQLPPERIDVNMRYTYIGSSEHSYDQHEVRQQQELLVTPEKNYDLTSSEENIGSQPFDVITNKQSTKRKHAFNVTEAEYVTASIIKDSEGMSQLTKRTKLSHPSPLNFCQPESHLVAQPLMCGLPHNTDSERESSMHQMPFIPNNADQLLGGDNMHINSAQETRLYNLQTMQPSQLVPEVVESTEINMYNIEVQLSGQNYDRLSQHETRQKEFWSFDLPMRHQSSPITSVTDKHSASETASLSYKIRDSKGEQQNVLHREIACIKHAVKCSRQAKYHSCTCKANMERLLDGLSGDESLFRTRLARLLDHNRKCRGCVLCLHIEAKLYQNLDDIIKRSHLANVTAAESVTPSTNEASKKISSSLVGVSVAKSHNMVKEIIPIPKQHVDQSEEKTEIQKVILLATKTSNGFDQENEVNVTLLHSTTLTTCETGENIHPPLRYKKTEQASLVELSQLTETYQLVESGKMQFEADKVGQEVKCMETAPSSDCGYSFVELFTPEQITKHILSLKKSFDQSEPKAVSEGLNEEAGDANKCDLCEEGSRFFEPRRYCTGCTCRIVVGAKYCIRRNCITTTAGDSENPYCVKCCKRIGGGFEKKENKRIEEEWVQCDKCNSRHHQICALFNGRKNEEKTRYTCPHCLLQSGAQQVISQGTVLGAKDLPKTKLSDDIEQRLARRLTEERQKRATKSGNNYDEVSSAEDLVVRVVSSVTKNVEVSKLFQKIVQEKEYPSEFPYKSKAILLFQKIDGVDVCLLGIYAQEFGSECAKPNQRRVCLSYIDSVKYFRPDIKSERGEPLRTFVYHEILVGYLDYCKKRGFTSFYIWVCPPCGKDDDYIFNCRPKAQKTHNVDSLRRWYQKLIDKATDEKIVVNATNLYNEFLNPHGEREVKATVARLPYFDGDYWPRAAHEFLLDSKNTLQSARSIRAGRHDTENGYTEDINLQNHIKDCINKKKADYIMLNFQHTCRCCCENILSGRRWVCRTCKNYQLCDRCYDKQLRLDKGNRHPIKQVKKHSFDKVEVDHVPGSIKDEDQDIENKICVTREAFLNLCKRQNYRFDTLRRAKHSSMMLLDHLHKS